MIHVRDQTIMSKTLLYIKISPLGWSHHGSECHLVTMKIEVQSSMQIFCNKTRLSRGTRTYAFNWPGFC